MITKICLKVKAAGKVDKIGGIILINNKQHLEVFVKARAESGKANIAVIKLLSKTFKVPQSNIEIILGHTNKYKVVSIKDL